ncbi:hypothetical protein U703_05185 [Rhodobacter capsulatus YW1]|nr:hypothetical protein U703_05185 [Rhodobacter capsulatus YW1]
MPRKSDIRPGAMLNVDKGNRLSGEIIKSPAGIVHRL